MACESLGYQLLDDRHAHSILSIAYYCINMEATPKVGRARMSGRLVTANPPFFHPGSPCFFPLAHQLHAICYLDGDGWPVLPINVVRTVQHEGASLLGSSRLRPTAVFLRGLAWNLGFLQIVLRCAFRLRPLQFMMGPRIFPPRPCWRRAADMPRFRGLPDEFSLPPLSNRLKSSSEYSSSELPGSSEHRHGARTTQPGWSHHPFVKRFKFFFWRISTCSILRHRFFRSNMINILNVQLYMI